MQFMDLKRTKNNMHLHNRLWHGAPTERPDNEHNEINTPIKVLKVNIH